jgi:aldose sugar dehydrogenase
VTALSLTVALAACSSGDPAGTSPPASPASAPPAGTAAGTTAAPQPGGAAATGQQRVSVSKVLATGLEVPWGVTFLSDGSALVGERPTGRIVRVGADGGVTPVGTVPGVADQGEGGLLGLAFRPTSSSAGTPTETGSTGTVFAYFTATAGDNRVASLSWDGQRLGSPRPILTGIRSAQNHNGGALTIGPDAKLWIGTGDARTGADSQSRSSLNGKILRIELDGGIPRDNPFPSSPVYSLGHRNVQGIAFDSRDQPWAVEFGQNTWDELNRIQAGGNYGWPQAEGRSDQDGLIDPLVQWPTDEASPSGLAIVRDVAYAGALRGQRLWQVPLPASATSTDSAADPRAWLVGEFGRLRSVAVSPGGTVWVTTSNRDGRGDPGADDDRVIRLSVT